MKKIIVILILALFIPAVPAQDKGQRKPITFESLAAKCLKQGGSPEECALIETRCKEIGATTAEECNRLSSGLEAFRSKITSGPLGSRPSGDRPLPHSVLCRWRGELEPAGALEPSCAHRS